MARGCVAMTPKTLMMTMLVMVLTVRAVSSLQSFHLEPQYTEVNPGQSAVLHCKINSKAGQCSWQKDGYPIGPEKNKYEWASEDGTDGNDCSLRVLGADLKYDDGLWSCQVTASSFLTQDALRSAPASLVVRVVPEPPQIVFGSVAIASGRNLTARLDDLVQVECSSPGGNPPAAIRWFVGEEDLTAHATQQNVSDSDIPRTWTAVSTLRHTFLRRQAGSYLRCVALHQAWETQSQDTIARLDLQYAPELSLVGPTDTDLEDGVSAAVLECRADANPPPKVVWRFAAAGTGRGEEYFVDKLEFRPVTRQNSGTYECEATNMIGKSRPLSVTLDIKYAPRIYQVQPARHVTVALHNSTSLSCDAEANPPASYRWLQGGSRQPATLRGSGPRLLLENVGYEHRGHYVCLAANAINGQERADRSEPVHLTVVGPPQMHRAPSPPIVPAVRGQQAVLEQRFCADPPPSTVTWLWEDQHLQAGHVRGRFTADELVQDTAEACYRARLRIQSAAPTDEREYIISAENQLGADRHALILQVKGAPLLAEPVSMVTVIAIAGSGLLLLIVLIAIICHAFKKGQCCFSHKGGFKPTDIESEKADTNGHGEAAGRHGIGAIPPDALYAGPKKPPQGIASYEFCSGEDESPGHPGSGGGGGAWGGIIYADLQLPRASNNGSMRKVRHPRRQGGPADTAPTPAVEYAVIKFPSAASEETSAERTEVGGVNDGRVDPQSG